MGFSAEIVEAVECLTRREGESYGEFIQRAKVNSLARRVKLADLQDNLDLTRIRDPGPEDWERVKRYHRSRQELLSD